MQAPDQDAGESSGDGARFVSFPVDPLIQRNAERVAQSRGTTLDQLVHDYVVSLAESDWKNLARLDWLDDPFDIVWRHLEEKHR